MLPALLALLAPLAHADGVVTAVQSADEVGAWTTWQPATGATTGEAFLLRDSARVALRVGDTVRDSDLIVTRRGRVRLEVAGKGEITVYDGTVVALEDYGLRHVLGGLLVEVQGAFRVQYATVEATVEGTRFRVEGDAAGQGAVLVEEGRVRVREEESAAEVVVTERQQAVVAPAAPPAKEPAVVGMRPPEARRHRPLSVGLFGGGGVGQHVGLDEPAGESRVELFSRLRLPGPFAVTASGGRVDSATTSHVPLGLQLEWWPLRWAGLGLGGELMAGRKEFADGRPAEAVWAGAMGLSGNVTVPLSARWSAESRVLGTWSTGPQVFGSLGVGVRL